MYTKLGLGALAIAGLTFGAVGMLTSAGASPSECRAPSSGVSAPASGDNGSTSVSAPDSSGTTADKGDNNKTTTKKPATTGTSPGATQPNQGSNDSGGSAGSNGSNGSADNGDGGGSGSGNGNLLTIDGGTNAPTDTNVNVSVPGNSTTPNAGSTSGDTSGSNGSNGRSTDRPFLDLQGRTATVQTPAGTVPVPPTDAHLIGRSWYTGSLLQITGRANVGS